MSTTDEIGYQKQGKVAVISLNRGPANAYYLEFLERFYDCLAMAEQDADVVSVLINSTSAKFFCAGADIKIFAHNSTEENQQMVTQARENLRLIEASSKIFIAAINGHCLGGGLELALACDIRLAAEGSYLLGLPEINLGLIPGNGGSQRLTKLVGMAQAMDLLLTGDSIDPQKAADISLINRLYAAETLQDEALAYASKLAAGPAKALAATKVAVSQGALMAMPEALALEAALVDQLYETEDAAEGFHAFIEKRPAQFCGR
ncbi:crotonase [Neiella marina]|uniref:Crotonase n=1 Tax=Neiella marina TaxID=508461 RepID=A0A8J2U8N6_9GAMM|nr:enoyl-CoA hydratase-related protein [Neiella marina]GGA86640.1 crotonase [Neiella marina]